MLLLSKCAVDYLVPEGLDDEPPDGELLKEPDPDSDGLLGLGAVGDDGLAPGVDEEEEDEEELPGELFSGVEEPEEAAPGLLGLLEAPDDEEEGGVLLGGVLLLVVVLDSLLHPTSAATTAAAQHSFARLPKVWSMYETPESRKGLRRTRAGSNAHACTAMHGDRGTPSSSPRKSDRSR